MKGPDGGCSGCRRGEEKTGGDCACTKEIKRLSAVCKIYKHRERSIIKYAKKQLIRSTSRGKSLRKMAKRYKMSRYNYNRLLDEYIKISNENRQMLRAISRISGATKCQCGLADENEDLKQELRHAKALLDGITTTWSNAFDECEEYVRREIGRAMSALNSERALSRWLIQQLSERDGADAATDDNHEPS